MFIYDLLLICLIVVILAIYLYQETTSLKIENLNLKSDKIKSQIKIMQLSDLHIKQIGKLEREIIKKVNKSTFDLLVITGDYIYKRNEGFFPILNKFLSKLNCRAPIIAILGDEDHKISISGLKKIIKSNNINILINESQSITIKDNSFNIIGVDTPDLKYHNLLKAMKLVDLENGYNIILSHTYDILDSISKNMDIDLILAGDTHGGQINIPFIGQKLLDLKYDMKYLSGKHLINNTILYINRGIGNSIIPIRFKSRPEITIIEITSDN